MAAVEVSLALRTAFRRVSDAVIHPCLGGLRPCVGLSQATAEVYLG